MKNKYYDSFYKYYDRNFYRCDRKNGDCTSPHGVRGPASRGWRGRVCRRDSGKEGGAAPQAHFGGRNPKNVRRKGNFVKNMFTFARQ